MKSFKYSQIDFSIEPLIQKERARKYGKSNRYFRKLFRLNSDGQITQAFERNTRQPGLLLKIKKHLDLLETKQSNSVSNNSH